MLCPCAKASISRMVARLAMKDPVIESWCATRSIESRADFVRLPVDSANRHRRLWAKKTCPPRGKPRAVKSEQCLGQRSRSRQFANPGDLSTPSVAGDAPTRRDAQFAESVYLFVRVADTGEALTGDQLALFLGGGTRSHPSARSTRPPNNHLTQGGFDKCGLCWGTLGRVAG